MRLPSAHDLSHPHIATDIEHEDNACSRFRRSRQISRGPARCSVGKPSTPDSRQSARVWSRELNLSGYVEAMAGGQFHLEHSAIASRVYETHLCRAVRQVQTSEKVCVRSGGSTVVAVKSRRSRSPKVERERPGPPLEDEWPCYLPTVTATAFLAVSAAVSFALLP